MLQRINIFGGPHSGKSTLINALTSSLVFEGHESIKEEEKILQFKEHGVFDWPTFRSFKKYTELDRDIIAQDINIFLLRSELTSNVTKEALELDSGILNFLHDLRLKIHVISFSEDAVDEIIGIIGTKGWLDKESNQF